ncbi:MAG: MMPL family transporter [Chloroflexi bacterium]|nr:MMPL family transporter [Chloroflexota bacterium]MDA1145578.1 MMPL family transporter [Chloroflexota bacterium]
MHDLNSTERLARGSARHPWITLLIWVAVIGGSLFAAIDYLDLTDDGDVTASTEANTAAELLDSRFQTNGTAIPDGIPVNQSAPFGNQEFVILEATDNADPAAFETAATDLVTALRANDRIAVVQSYLDDQPGYLSEDGHAALIAVTGDGLETVAVIGAVEAAHPGFRVTTIGNDSINEEFNTLAEETLLRGELLGISLALVILLLVFGAAFAAGLPIVLAIVAIVVAVGATALVGQVFDLSTFVVNIITMIGLAVGIDYSLFIVQRYREELDNGLDKIDAITLAGGTASRAVLFSGLAVVIALSGMFIIPDSTFNSFGAGAILVVIAAVAAALTLLPAVLSLIGRSVNWLTLPIIGRRRSPEIEGGVWYRITAAVTRRPAITAGFTAVVLIAVASFYLTINLGSNGISSLPDASPGRHAFEVLNAEFTNSPNEAKIVIDTPDIEDPRVIEAIGALEDLLAGDDAFGAPVFTPSLSGDLGLIEVPMKGDFSSAESRDALSRLRSDYIPASLATVAGVAAVYVGGDAADDIDYVGVIGDYTPIVFAYVLGFSFLLLLVTFRSIVVPLKAVLMNLLSVGAAYGLLVLVFQHGIGASLFGFRQTEVIEPWLPLFLFTILFGLSMDYHVFLLSRIKERYDETGDNHHSVAFGLRSTGALITGAAMIMVAVFGGFATGDLLMFQQMGFGLAVAVILDATVIRSVLVPATMDLLGDRNWYFPAWLEWLPEIHIEGRPRPALAEARVGGPEAAAVAAER